MTKIQSGAGDGQWHKPPVLPPSTAVSTSQTAPATPSAAANQAALRAGVTRFIESASPAASAVYTEALLQKQEKTAEFASAHAEQAPPRTLSDLPYLAYPEWGARSKGNSSAPINESTPHPAAKSSRSKTTARVPTLSLNSWWFLLIVAMIVFLLALSLA